jgi:hypothetical protein
MFTSNPPFAEVQNNELHFVYKLPNAEFDIDGDVGRRLGYINQYLRSLRDSAEIFKNDLQRLVSSFIEQRKRERGTHAQGDFPTSFLRLRHLACILLHVWQ